MNYKGRLEGDHYCTDNCPNLDEAYMFKFVTSYLAMKQVCTRNIEQKLLDFRIRVVLEADNLWRAFSMQ